MQVEVGAVAVPTPLGGEGGGAAVHRASVHELEVHVLEVDLDRELVLEHLAAQCALACVVLGQIYLREDIVMRIILF